MSHYVTPFLVLNLGCEMVFVVAQRLQAQKISAERTHLVLDEIISVLISKQLMTELMKPQAAYNHEALRDIIEDVAQSSAMRLDTISMGKLWDLITMVYKWQLTMANGEVIPITLRHLYEIETYITNPDTQLQLHKVQNLVDNFNKILNSKEKEELRDGLLYWLKDCSVRVSLLLRMGLQAMDGNFIVDHLDPIAEDMLKNLGENIYAATDNGKILENKNNSTFVTSPQDSYSYQPRGVNELQLFVDQILGDRKLSDASNSDSYPPTGRVLRLSIDEQNGNNNDDGLGVDNVINIRTEDQIDHFMSDLDLNNDVINEEKSLKDDLLEMIGGVDLQPDEV